MKLPDIIDGMLQMARRRWRIIVALLLLSFSLVVVYFLTHQTDAGRALKRVNMGMTRNNVKVNVEGTERFKYYFSYDISTNEHGELWEFMDKSELRIYYYNGKVVGVEEGEPYWLMYSRWWLRDYLGINAF